MKEKLSSFLDMCTYVSGQYDQDDGFEELEKHLQEIEGGYKDKGARNRIFYMALPPSVFTTVAAMLKKHNYSSDGINRIIVEKPFGKDLESSREMMVALRDKWAEKEVRQSCSAAAATAKAACRSSALTTISARRWSRTCLSCALATSSSTPLSTRT